MKWNCDKLKPTHLYYIFETRFNCLELCFPLKEAYLKPFTIICCISISKQKEVYILLKYSMLLNLAIDKFVRS